VGLALALFSMPIVLAVFAARRIALTYSERLASRDHLVRLSSLGVVHHQEKGAPGLGLRRFATPGVG